jgi:hypothetical protein
VPPFHGILLVSFVVYFTILSVSRLGAGISQSVKRLAAGWTSEGSELESRKVKEFSLFNVVQTGPGDHPASYPMCTGDSLPGVKMPGREAAHSPPTSAEVKKMWICTSTPWRAA